MPDDVTEVARIRAEFAAATTLGGRLSRSALSGDLRQAPHSPSRAASIACAGPSPPSLLSKSAPANSSWLVPNLDEAVGRTKPCCESPIGSGRLPSGYLPAPLGSTWPAFRQRLRSRDSWTAWSMSRAPGSRRARQSHQCARIDLAGIRIRVQRLHKVPGELLKWVSTGMANGLLMEYSDSAPPFVRFRTSLDSTAENGPGGDIR
jgi:hypothetical protein